MKDTPSLLWSILLWAVVPLLTAGCEGAGLSSLLFGGSDTAEILSSLAGGGSGVSGDGLLDGLLSGSISSDSNPGGGDQLISDVATVHHPEPVSLALFGGGFASLALMRRRKAARRTSHSIKPL